MRRGRILTWSLFKATCTIYGPRQNAGGRTPTSSVRMTLHLDIKTDRNDLAFLLHTRYRVYRDEQ